MHNYCLLGAEFTFGNTNILTANNSFSVKSMECPQGNGPSFLSSVSKAIQN